MHDDFVHCSQPDACRKAGVEFVDLTRFDGRIKLAPDYACKPLEYLGALFLEGVEFIKPCNLLCNKDSFIFSGFF